jgi:hypothetical protein
MFGADAARMKAVERGPGRAPIDPKILMALWLYATIDGVGSARQLDELGRTHARRLPEHDGRDLDRCSEFPPSLPGGEQTLH